jgi:DNA-directed RNA polymerase subunit RPC12/RpoP
MVVQTTTAISGEKRRTKEGVFVCPSCGYEHWSIIAENDGSAKCRKCGKIMGKGKEQLDKLVVEKEVDGYVCPICKKIVADISENHTSDDTINGDSAILCPKCYNFVNDLPLLHHGAYSEKWEPLMSSTDYFFFQHKPCKDKEHHGSCDIYACLIDNTGRVIFNLQCLDCKTVDAVKTTVPFGAKTPERIFLSPELERRIGKHPWDNR